MQIYIYRNGQQYGPYEEATVSAWSRSGGCSLTDLAIREGMNEWQPLWAVMQAPDGTSGDLDAEFKLFESYGVIADSITHDLRGPDPRKCGQAFRQYEQVLAILEKQFVGLKRQFRGTPELSVMESFYYGKCAGLELFKNNMAGALDLFDKSISIMDWPAAHLVKASIYQNLNRRREAIRELDWIIANFPDQPEYAPAQQMRQQM
jgi:tetratricopeptide (TPR) repeat protein